MIFEVTLLGTNAALPAHGRHPSAQLVNLQDNYILVDCGEGTQMRLQEHKIKWGRINWILISHMHGDHVYGLVALLTSYNLLGRTSPLSIYGPVELKKFIEDQLQRSYTQLNFPIEIHIVDPTKFEKVFENKVMEFWSVPLHHRIPTNGYLIKEKKRQPNIRPEMIEKYQLSIPQILAVKAGKDLTLPDGDVIANDLLVKPASLPRSYAYCSDTMYEESIVPYINEVDLLYHESTFLDADQERAIFTKHSTASDAAKIAKQAKVSKLILGHFSSRQKDIKLFEEEAKKIFPNTIAGEEGMVIEIPFQGRGQ